MAGKEFSFRLVGGAGRGGLERRIWEPGRKESMSDSGGGIC